MALEEIHHQRASIPGQLILQNAQPLIDTLFSYKKRLSHFGISGIGSLNHPEGTE